MRLRAHKRETRKREREREREMWPGRRAAAALAGRAAGFGPARSLSTAAAPNGAAADAYVDRTRGAGTRTPHVR